MLRPPLQPIDRKTVAALQKDRLRVHVEQMELIAGSRKTIAESQELLIQADAILASEKAPLLKSNRR
jgi:hypothetical protein